MLWNNRLSDKQKKTMIKTWFEDDEELEGDPGSSLESEDETE